jgi:hypothetical protein
MYVSYKTPEDFLETSNAPGAFYSVAAKPKAEEPQFYHLEDK